MRAGEWAGMEPPWLHYPAWMAPTYQRGGSNHQVLVLAVSRVSPLRTHSEDQVWSAGCLIAAAGRDTRNAKQSTVDSSGLGKPEGAAGVCLVGSDHPGLFLPAEDPQLLCQQVANPCWCHLKVKSRKPTLSLCGWTGCWHGVLCPAGLNTKTRFISWPARNMSGMWARPEGRGPYLTGALLEGGGISS